MAYSVTALGPETWDGFADLVERNNGIFGGCWCIGFEDLGFTRMRPVGTHAWVVQRWLAATP
ncbi:hypothetical protein [Knoellia aerolata]|uniref:GNAT family N-acetyltransferase n=1 Tax=Knoellia aerolata DSM 18566 TaxID=1385519 RepID=A0A0A0JQJ6_9MICO|nr:hypothetical protein [Knoellia aerolata]KGN39750.1 hypothetical protein N801_19105 [Knoellia aerolata DSM 18566]